jgi:hypothetical protein
MSGEYAFKFTEMTDERVYVGPDGICSEGLLWRAREVARLKCRCGRGGSTGRARGQSRPRLPSRARLQSAGVAGELSVDHIEAAPIPAQTQ